MLVRQDLIDKKATELSITRSHKITCVCVDPFSTLGEIKMGEDGCVSLWRKQWVWLRPQSGTQS